MFVREKTSKSIDNFIKGEHGGLILLGNKGLGKRKLAERIAQAILSTNSLYASPDFVFVEAQSGVIKIDDLKLIKQHASLCAVESNKKVILIDDADTMTVSAQNSLLKLLEDFNDKNVFILVAHNPVLDTIQSRCKVINVEAPTREEMQEYLLKENGDINKLAFVMANNNPGVYYFLLSEPKFLENVACFFKAFCIRNLSQVYSSLGMMKEKEMNGFFQKYSNDNIILFLNLIRDVLLELICYTYGKKIDDNLSALFDMQKASEYYTVKKCIENVEYINDHIFRLKRKGTYTKNDFFDLFRYII